MLTTTDTETETLITVSPAARILNKSAETVRQYGEAGRLQMRRTASGFRLFVLADVERLARELAARKAA